MKVVLFTDPHVHPFQRFASYEHGINSRLTIAIDAVAEVSKYCREHDVDVCVCLGDVFNTRGLVHTMAFNKTAQVLATFRCPLVFVVGNHDLASLNSRESVIDALRRVVQQPEPPREFWDVFSLVDYNHDPKALMKVIDGISRTRIILGHFAAEGGVAGSGYTSPEGQKLKLLDQFKRVFLGHYHTRQQLSPVVSYIGGLLQINFSDSGPHGFCEYDTDSNDLEYVDLATPQFITRGVGADGRVPLNDVRGNYVRVRGTGREGLEFEIERVLREAGALGVRFELEKSWQHGEQRIQVDQDMDLSLDTLVSTYVEYCNPELDRDRLIRLAQELTSE